MGVHICLLKNHEDHPGWDYLRQANDSEFTQLIDWEDITYRDGDPHTEEWRPNNMESIRSKIMGTEWHNMDRYLSLMMLLEKDADCWLHFSW